MNLRESSLPHFVVKEHPKYGKATSLLPSLGLMPTWFTLFIGSDHGHQTTLCESAFILIIRRRYNCYVIAL